jgi:hypothetical protein
VCESCEVNCAGVPAGQCNVTCGSGSPPVCSNNTCKC